jgi:hypothetical protein
MCNLENFLQLNIRQELPLFASVYMCLGAGYVSLGFVTVTLELFPCFHITCILFASSWYLFCFSVIVLAKLCVFGIAMSIRKVFFVFLFVRVM